MNEITTFCPNCRSPLFFTTAIDDVRMKCWECGLIQYGRNRVLKFDRIARVLSRGIAPKRLSR